MLSYDKWKMLNESLGRATLGISQRPSLGLISNLRVPVTKEGWNEDDVEPADEMGDHPVDMGDYSDEMGDDEMPSRKKHMSHMNSDHEEDVESSDEEDFGDDDDDVEEDDDESDEDGDDDEEDGDDAHAEMHHSEDGDEEDFGDDDDDVEEDGDDAHAKMHHSEDGDEEEFSDKPAMGENKKMSKHMLSEKDWWASLKNMVGQVQPNGSIKNESFLMNALEPTAPEDNDIKFSGIVNTILSKFDVASDKFDDLSKTKNMAALEHFVKALAQGLHDEKKVSYNSLKNVLKRFIDDLAKKEVMDKNQDQTASAM